MILKYHEILLQYSDAKNEEKKVALTALCYLTMHVLIGYACKLYNISSKLPSPLACKNLRLVESPPEGVLHHDNAYD